MGFLSALPLIGTIFKEGRQLIDDLHTSDEEKLQAHQKLRQLETEAQIQLETLELSFQQQVTDRHKADMQSDSFLSKNVRPLTLIFLTGILVLLSILDNNLQIGDHTFNVQDEYIDLYKALLLTAFGFYFGSRGLEKSVKMWSATKGQKHGRIG